MKTLISTGAALGVVLLFYLLFLNHVDINEVGVAYDSTSGKITKQGPGWHVTHPLVRTTTISLLPMKVEVNPGSSARVINVRLVRFVPEHLDEFIAAQGFAYYGNGSMPYLLAPYVFSNKSYPFIEIIQ